MQSSTKAKKKMSMGLAVRAAKTCLKLIEEDDDTLVIFVQSTINLENGEIIPLVVLLYPFIYMFAATIKSD